MSSTPFSGNILIIDNDTNITDLLQVNLRSEGYCVDIVDEARKVDFGQLGQTRLAIIDLMNCDYSGLELVSDLKSDPRTSHIGIILYSNIKSERIVIEALDAGADDYIVKPFSLREMLARVKAILRRQAPKAASGSVLTFKELSVNQLTQTVKIDGQPLLLTKTEYAILLLLLRNQDTFVSRAEIHTNVWPEGKTDANKRIVDTNISRLRKKLGEIGNNIVNRTGHGYMLTANG